MRLDSSSAAVAAVAAVRDSIGAPHDILLILPHLGAGGAQRVATLLANDWAKSGLRVCLATTSSKRSDAHPLTTAVHRVHLDTVARALRKAGRSKREKAEIDAPASSRTVARQCYLVLKRASKNLKRAIHSAATPHGAQLVVRCLTAAVIRRAREGRVCAEAAAMSSSRPALDGVAAQPDLGWGLGGLAALLDFGMFRRIARLRRLIELSSAPVIVSFLAKTNCDVVIACHRLNVQLVISERNDPTRQQLQTYYRDLRRLCYGAADVVTANSQGALDAMAGYVAPHKLVLAPNPLMLPKPSPPMRRGDRLLCVARLVPQKGVDVLLRAMVRIIEEPVATGWILDILGDGCDRSDLEAQAVELGLEAHVRFHGFVGEPGPFFGRADLFVLASRFEGMPNAMLEAMIQGVPVIVTDGSPGPLEFVKHDRTGWVVPADDDEALARALLHLIGAPETRERLGAAGKACVSRLLIGEARKVWDGLLGLKERPREIVPGAERKNPLCA
jgi:GalNAc-alpha-(1->4)-GalNAc-alpha-(1->3)-diNAcBac-PP-undecaprenol alpha-1,4-N-acetyl-D-galactosaminyltransferase